ncbi:MAG TPA: ribbon-helix-helix protein, CopG family [Burkholderiaceae bacterium]|nr:ribbon-helix-helix protein, CopG family [Burkholderiaceae bacterium]
MTTTTLRLSEPLKERISELAEQTGQTAHAFMLQAIEDRVRDEEARQAFASEAQARYDEAMASGRALDWHEMRDYLRQRAAVGKAGKVKAPRARAWRA